MLTMLGSPRRSCDGVTRRETLKAGSLAVLGGFGLPQLLQAEASGNPGKRPGKAKSVIVLYLLGGAATQDMIDLKPNAPAEVRGEFRPIATNVPGIQVCEHLPLMSRWMHKIALVRSLNHKAGCHNTLPSYTGLPLGEVHSYEGETTWKKLARLDHTPDVKYRRVWTMAEHDGRLFASTLPSGKVFAYSAGQQAMWGHTLSVGWHHVAAVKSANRLTLFVDGARVAQTPPFDATSYQVDASHPLRIGTGSNGPLNGSLADVRIYRRALGGAEVEALAEIKPKE